MGADCARRAPNEPNAQTALVRISLLSAYREFVATSNVWTANTDLASRNAFASRFFPSHCSLMSDGLKQLWLETKP